ncbi:adenylyltransferase/cytidyltransferase family protein [Listeria booriae]|uniref:adenylyltransferase/cytidyltransferase family protein n=1 Tax=Listeria booriae TaxID=1552123 RepID=UPI0016288A4F|nr:adenylyltransferase/cytidyltransferase family protein [Listeria booriae]MBC1231938.1 adenylyltransferase/cytidyltransferase family protein [Listeria booriae]MBC1234455.1 adenylyltransferase/cytidyltransferase family protein [Listeria booriae]MBC1246869.1 adenylyltransferase/cytidyltransferase family protein [Listeria booriae]MBC1273607.1 adenylyltransferase/cytidyltransferase family protein [Listeria booriae]MBC2388947.1 adenylyltransferase/cytidyltransferase family protein [Listeria booria
MKKYKLGYTSGVFDLFHIGHLNILKKAKEQCEHLIVAVSTDELVQSYKNKTPVIPFAERLEIVQAISFVDEVTAQTTRDKIAAMEKFQFDVMFVGSDWKGSPLFTETERILKANGVDVVYFPYTSNTSSTLLTQTLNKIVQTH